MSILQSTMRVHICLIIGVWLALLPNATFAAILDPPTGIEKALANAQPQLQFTRIPPPGPGESYVPEGFVLEDFQLGAGDTLNIYLWNPKLNLSYSLTVTPEGLLFIPKLGSFQVIGKTPEMLKKDIEGRVREFQNEKVQVSVSVQRVRSIKILITGHVKNPGYYTLQWGSRLMDILRAAGGVNDNGSVRYLRLQDAEGVKTVDLYRFNYEGILTANPRLKVGLQIHVPTIGPHVALLGHLRQPGIYEIVPGEHLANILELAGGLAPDADRQHIILWKAGLKDGNQHFSELKVHDPYALQNGDIIYIQSRKLPAEQNVVYIYGQIRQPGVVVFQRGLSVSEALRQAGGPTDRADLNGVQISRQNKEGKRYRLVTDTHAFLFEGQAQADPFLEPGDIIFVPEAFFALKNINELTNLILTGLGIVSVVINLSRSQ